MSDRYYRLRIKSLKFISAVDAGAQGPIANVALIKRAPVGDDVDATCHVVKIDEKMGLVFGWALATTLDGGATPHVDLQQDAIVGDDELIKIAAEFMEQSAASDVMHDDNPDGKIVFCIPLTKAVIEALGITSKVEGLAIGMRPSPETFKRFVSKELNAFSIAGVGERESVTKTDAPKCASCGKYGKAADEVCKDCGKAMKFAAPTAAAKGLLSTADKDSLPDSAFLYVESGGTKDGGKTTPLSLRHFPYRDSAGKLDVAHLRAACSDIPKSSLPKDVRDKLQVRAEKLLGQQHMAAKRSAVAAAVPATTAQAAPPVPPAPVTKRSVITSAIDGHAHSVDLCAPASGWWTGLSTGYATSEGADQQHQHAWSYDPATGAVEIAMDSGHSHTVEDTVSPEIRAQAAARDEAPSDGVCEAKSDEDSGSRPSVIAISMGAPGAISTPSSGASSVGVTKEPTEMPDANDKIRELERANAKLTKMCSLTDGQRKHFAKLSGDSAESFLNLNPQQRQHALDEILKADLEVYTSKSSGRVYRQSDATELIEAAKTVDAMNVEIELQKAKTRELEFSKRGDEILTHFAKGAKKNLRARIIKAFHVEFSDPAEYEEAVNAVKQSNAALVEQTTAKGHTPGDDAGAQNTPQKRLNDAVADFAKRNNMPLHIAMERATATDPEIRRLYNEASMAGN